MPPSDMTAPSPQDSTRPQAHKPARNGSIDGLRWLGAIGIVWFHMALPGGGIGYAALPFFVTMLIYFGPDRPLLDRANRLLMPWAIWSVIYGGLKLLECTLLNIPLSQEFQPWMLLTGPSIHLWFLPYCFGVLVILRGLSRTGLRVVAAIGVPVTLWMANELALPTPFAQWAAVFPAAILGLAMHREGPQMAPTLCFGTAATMGLVWLLGWQDMTFQIGLAALAIGGALLVPLPAPKWVIWVSGLSLGVYLIHPLVIAVGHRLGISDWVLLAFALVGSHIATLVLQRLWPRSV